MQLTDIHRREQSRPLISAESIRCNAHCKSNNVQQQVSRSWQPHKLPSLPWNTHDWAHTWSTSDLTRYWNHKCFEDADWFFFQNTYCTNIPDDIQLIFQIITAGKFGIICLGLSVFITMSGVVSGFLFQWDYLWSFNHVLKIGLLIRIINFIF